MQASQQIIIIDKSKVEIDSVTAVRSFEEDSVLIETAFGPIGIEGKEMKIENLEKTTTKILITGNIEGVYYIKNRDKKRGRVIHQ